MLSIPFKRKEPSYDQLFLEMIHNHKDQFYRIAYSYVKNEHDSLDVIQDSVCKAYENLSKIREPQFMKTWFTRILINTATHHLAQKKKIEPSQTLEGLITHEDQLEEQTVNRLTLNQTLDQLNARERAIITLRYFEDYKIEEVAKCVDLPVNTTKSTLYRALKKMKIMLEEDTQDEPSINDFERNL